MQSSILSLTDLYWMIRYTISYDTDSIVITVVLNLIFFCFLSDCYTLSGLDVTKYRFLFSSYIFGTYLQNRVCQPLMAAVRMSTQSLN